MVVHHHGTECSTSFVFFYFLNGLLSSRSRSQWRLTYNQNMTAAELVEAEAGIFASVTLIAIPVHPSIPIQ